MPGVQFQARNLAFGIYIVNLYSIEHLIRRYIDKRLENIVEMEVKILILSFRMVFVLFPTAKKMCFLTVQYGLFSARADLLLSSINNSEPSEHYDVTWCWVSKRASFSFLVIY